MSVEKIQFKSYDGTMTRAAGVREGSGISTYTNGDRYEGEYHDGKRHGKGVFYYADNGEVYDGEWKNNLLHGFGTYKYSNGDTYEGEWLDDLKHGQGKYSFSNGDEYKGYGFLIFLNWMT